MLSKQLTHRTLIQYNKEIGHLYVPNLKMRVPYSENPYYIITNNQGFRSNIDYTRENKGGKKRILYLGDSYTAGDGVENEKRFSDLIVKNFDAESYNFGLSGSGIDQQYLIYKQIAIKYDHDILVISPHIGDIVRNTMANRLAIESETGEQILVPKPYFTVENSKLDLHNYPVPKNRKIVTDYKNQERLINPPDFFRKFFHKYVPNSIKDYILKLQLSNQYYGYQDEENPRWVLMKLLIEEIISISKANEIILAPLPYHNVKINPKFDERFINISKKYDNVHYVDVLSKFKKIKNQDKLYYRKDSHYSEYAHSIVAETISNKISELKLLKSENDQEKIAGQVTEHSEKESTYILGISGLYHDSASTLIKDGKIISAAQEERFTRKKNDAKFPFKAINYCLEEAGIQMEDIKAVAFYDNPYLTLERIISSQIVAYPSGKEIWTELFSKWALVKLRIPEIICNELNYHGDIYFVKHHLSHSASAFYASPFSKAAILTVDGVGEWATASISYGEDSRVKMIKEMRYPNSVGLLYSAFTFYTGFKVNEGEYKMMGLAPYGEPKYVDLIKEKLIKIHSDGSISLDMKYFGFNNQLCMINEDFEKLFGGPARKTDESITQKFRDIAKSIQVVIEEIIIKMARYAKEATKADYLCLAGGVALNCVANGKLLAENVFEDLWIQPAAGDAGGSLGAALAVYHSYFQTHNDNDSDTSKNSNECIQSGSLWGPEFSDEEIKAYLDSYDLKYRKLNANKRNAVIASYLNEGKVVGHFSGRMEFGPRALGSRSILGDARNKQAQSVLNKKIKFRESFRPFAPSVLEEDVNEYFDICSTSPYMLLVTNLKENRCVKYEFQHETDIIKIVNQKRSDLPAITHVDYSARVQTVNRRLHPDFYDLIKEFKKLTGYGVIINTSFNVNGEPIVCTPKDASTCFMVTEMDVLVMNNFLLLKNEQTKDKISKYRNAKSRVKSPSKNNKNKKVSNIKKKSNKIYDDYFEHFNRLNIKSHIYMFNNSQNPSWNDVENHTYFDINRGSQTISPEEILDKWEIMPATHKKNILPLISEIIEMSKKYKHIDDVIDYDIPDSIYVMF
ncbi:MAG: carbamoyltransferase N-terminal domain-containing protein [Cyclobacteriaceae bacterium]